MISELDIWRAANLLIRRYGADAELEAARLADMMLDRGDLEGQQVWRRIRWAECPATPHLSGTTEDGLAVFSEKEREPVKLPVISAQSRTWSTGDRGAVGTLLHLAVIGLVAVAIIASFGEF